MPTLLHFNRLGDWPSLEGGEQVFRRAALAALESQGRDDGEISFTFVAADEIQALNREYLGREHPTDVIAFDLGEGSEVLGDVYISPPVAAENAAERGEAERHEVTRLVIHGTLHVLGMDHPEGPERESAPMFTLQEELLRDLPSG